MEQPALVLFLCTSNYYRSRFAEAVFNYYATLAGLPWRAFSRGLTPHLMRGDLSPQVQDALLVRGISPGYLSPRKQALAREDLERAQRVIALQEEEHRPLMRLYFPDWEERIEYWSADGSLRWDAASVLAAIESQVQDLVCELAREQVCHSCRRAS